MFERYTEKARRTIFFARFEASQFGSSHIETEHLLLGILREDKELASRLFEAPSELPADIASELAKVQGRIKFIVHRTENAVANQEFEKARFYSEEERKARAELDELRKKNKISSVSATVEDIRRRIEMSTPRGEKVSTSVDLPLSQECKRALGYAVEQVEALNQEHITPAHLLLGLLLVGKGLACDILQELGVTIDRVRALAVDEPASLAFNQLERGLRSQILEGLRTHRRPDLGWMSVLQYAARTIYLARHEADRLGSPCVETTHVLLALAHEKEIAEKHLGSAGEIHSRIQAEAKPAREKVAASDLPFSDDCKSAFAIAVQEAAHLGQQAGPVHLLLGILSVENCAAASILRECGIDAAGIRAKLGTPPPSAGPEQGRDYV